MSSATTVKKFYFTFGTSESYPFQGGWVEIFAEDRKKAAEVFRKHHPDKFEGTLNCADVYSEEGFSKTKMVDGNFGERCHAVYHQPMQDDNLLCEAGDKIDNAVFAAISAVAHKYIDWDMNIIGEVTDFIESALSSRGIEICHPWQDWDGNICYSSEERCTYCKRGGE